MHESNHYPLPKGARKHNLPDISIPKSGKASNGRVQMCGGIPNCHTGDGTMKHSGFVGRSGNGSGSHGQVGPKGEGFQSSLKGSRSPRFDRGTMNSMGFKERG